MIYVVLEGNVWKQKHVGIGARRRKERFEQVDDESAQTGSGEREAGYKGVECYLLEGTPYMYDPTDFNSLVVLHVPPTGSYRTYLDVGMLATVHSAARLMMVFAES